MFSYNDRHFKIKQGERDEGKNSESDGQMDRRSDRLIDTHTRID